MTFHSLNVTFTVHMFCNITFITQRLCTTTKSHTNSCSDVFRYMLMPSSGSPTDVILFPVPLQSDVKSDALRSLFLYIC
jgi:hypothetical protein